MRWHEFGIGDIVTYHAYGNEKIPARIIAITLDGHYTLEGVKRPLISTTTGRHIRESDDFVDPDESSE